MDVLLNFLIFAAGIAMLMKAGDVFVDSARKMAEVLNVPHVVVGFTIVSLATTAPEFAVSFMSALLGERGITLGNVVGSCIVNIGVILSVSAIARPLIGSKREIGNAVFMLVVGAIMAAMALSSGEISNVEGVILLLLLFSFIWQTVKQELKERARDGRKRRGNIKKVLPFFIAGAIGIVIGGRLLIFSSVNIARFFGIPEVVIGLTLIAVGTSMPELVTAIFSIKKKITDISLGNIIGANTLNVLWVMGASSSLVPIPVDFKTMVFSIPTMLILMVMLCTFLITKRRVSRVEGASMLVVYLIYISILDILY